MMVFVLTMRCVTSHNKPFLRRTHLFPPGMIDSMATLVEEHLGPLRDQLGISFDQLMGLGRVEPQNDYRDVSA